MKKNNKIEALSIADFEMFCVDRKLSSFKYYAKNQPHESRLMNLDESYEFTDVAVSFPPNTVIFRKNQNYIRFKLLKNVNVEKIESGYCFELVCEGIDGDRKFVIIAS